MRWPTALAAFLYLAVVCYIAYVAMVELMNG